MKTLCLGGSFNPIHHGHLICARAVAEKAGFQRVVLIPSHQPPHKPDRPDLAAAADRLEMCRIAAQSCTYDATNTAAVRFSVSDLELNRTGPSYTIDTVRELRRLGWNQVHWLIGADMLLYLPKWHDVTSLLRETTFLVMARPGIPIDWATLPAAFQPLRDNVVEAPLVQISSTQIRQRVRAGLSIDYLTPAGVVDYIRERHLYVG